MGVELALFLTLGVVAILAAAAMIVVKNAVHSALFLIVNFGCVALLFLMLQAPFLSMVQVAVYAGAIMVLFLFVIMLLGAEQSSDTSRSFRWITYAATALTGVFLVALAIPFVISGGLHLPEPAGNQPLLRVVHAAKVPEAVSVTVSGEGLEQDLVLADLGYGAVSDFQTLNAGTYQLTVTLSGFPLYETELSLAGGDVYTAVALGEFIPGNSSFDVVLVPNNLSDSGENAARVVVVNGFSTEEVKLVDLGANRRFDENSEGIADRILVDALGFGAVSEAFSYSAGEHTLGFYAFVNGAYERIAALDDYAVSAATEQTILLVPDYDAPPNLDGSYRPRVLYRNEGTLNIPTAESFGSPGDIGQQLFTRYLLPVNLVGFLLLVALIGAIVLTRPEGIKTERRSTRNRRRKVSRPLVSVISQQTGSDVLSQDTPKLDEPAAGD